MADETETNPNATAPQPDDKQASGGVDLSDFSSEVAEEGAERAGKYYDSEQEKARDREAILDVPVKITAVVGDVKMPVRDLVRLGRGAVVPLNRKLGASIDIYANDRLIARGEITIIEDDNIAVTMTEIMSSSASV